MSFKILKKNTLSPGIISIEVDAPLVARKHKPGQFVLLRVNETGERIPLTVVEKDLKKGSITLIFQVVGKTTALLRDQLEGGTLLDVVGPLGTPTHIEKFGTAVCVGGGIGVAPIYSIAKGLKEAGNKIIGIIGAQKAETLILEEELGRLTERLLISTDDGSKGRRGFVTDILSEIMKSGEPLHFVIAIGPLPMMKAVANLTRAAGIKTMVSLNSIMVDGTGMCGGCRVTVGGKNRFTCTDGPEFDGHLVDFDVVAKRAQAYREYETCSRQNHQNS